MPGESELEKIIEHFRVATLIFDASATQSWKLCQQGWHRVLKYHEIQYGYLILCFCGHRIDFKDRFHSILRMETPGS